MTNCFDLWTCIDNVLRDSRAQALAKGLTLECTPDASVPRRVWADEQRVRQILTNLVRNAVNCTTKGRIDITVDIPEEGGSGNFIRIAVSDTGIGMSEVLRAQLFNPTEQPAESSGLGLTISRRLAARIGGTLGAESEPGRGSTVWFTFRSEQPRQHAADLGTCVPKTSPAATELPVIDAQQRLKFAAGDPQLAQELLDMLLSELPERQAKIAHALKIMDIDGIAQQAHTLAGGTAYCGVPALKHACDRLKQTATNNADVAAIRREVDNLNAEIARLRALATTLPRSHPTNSG